MKWIFLIILFMSCSCLKYKDDKMFMFSGEANAHEFPLIVNGKQCLDMDYKLGLCSLRLVEGRELVLSHYRQSYAYRVKITCSRDLNADTTKDVLKGKAFKHIIRLDNYKGLKSFICIGSIYPKNRPEPINAKWEVRVKIQSSEYVEREEIYKVKHKGKSYLILGTNAKHSRVKQFGKWKRYNKKTMIKIKDHKGIEAISESYNMRFNHFKANGEK
jgi:hypothetical protein